MAGLSLRAIKQFGNHGTGHIDAAYLGHAFDGIGRPHYFPVMMNLFSAKHRFYPNMDKTLMYATGGKGGITTIDTEKYRWRLVGAEETYGRIIEDIEPLNTTKGLNGTTFKIKADIDYWREPDVLVFSDNEFKAEIIGAGIPDGMGTIYTVRLMGDNPSKVLPNTLLEPGMELSKNWTFLQTEYASKGGTQQFGGYFELEGQVGAFGQELSISDKAWREDGRLEFEFVNHNADGTTEIVKRFLPVAEAKMKEEYMSSIERQLMYGEKTTRVSDDGYWKQQGSGLREQMKDGWSVYYNGALTVAMLSDYVMNIFFARKNEEDRSVESLTGTYGGGIFHKLLASEVRSLLTVDSYHIQKLAGSGTQQLSYGSRFVKYNGIYNEQITLRYISMYDDRRNCLQSHPLYPGKPVDSFRMTFADFGSYNGDQNIKMLTVKDTYQDFYVAGSWSPMGAVKSGQATSNVNGYSLHVRGTAGIVMHDPTRGGELIPLFV